MGLTDIALLTAGILLLGTTDSVQGSCPAGWIHIGSQCYIKTDELMTHAEGVDFCSSLSTEYGTGSLATFPLCDDFTSFANYLGLAAPEDSNYWVGAKTDFLGDWYWETLEPLQPGVPFWAYGEGEDEGEDCAAMDRNFYFQLIDDGCETMKGVACMAPATDTKVPIKIKEFEVINCPEDTTQVGDHCYYFSHGHDYSWDDADWRCQNEHHFVDKDDQKWHGELFCPESCEEFTHLAHHLEAENDYDYWVGGIDVSGYNEWTWVNGETLPSGVPYWAYGQPDSSNTGSPRDHCAMMDGGEREHYLSDHSCNKEYGYICKMYIV